MKPDETPPDMTPREELKHDALSGNTCDCCACWHNPEGGPIGACVLNPATVFIVGMQPVSSIMDPKRPPAAQPVIRAYYPPHFARDGCKQWMPRKREIN